MSESRRDELQRIPIVVLGAGGVGAALLRQIADGRARTADRARCRFEVVAIADRTSAWVAPGGLTDAELRDAVAAKARREPVDPARRGGTAGLATAPGDLVALVDRVAAHLGQPAILVDVTAAAGLEPVLDRALDLGWSVALANKKALAGPWGRARRYFDNPRLRHESTVGGGQPVIATLRYLVDTDDPILGIEGQLSGTLGFLCTALEAGRPFSGALAEAVERGYTEPDPREDLAGRDVVRKAVILARLAGWPIEAADVAVEALFPAELAEHSVAGFLAATPDLDGAFAARFAAAKEAGLRLRYLARLAPGRAEVGLTPIPHESPYANLKYVSIRTARYDDEPLLIGGKGAGVEMTAAGVVGDLIGLAREVLRA